MSVRGGWGTWRALARVAALSAALVSSGCAGSGEPDLGPAPNYQLGGQTGSLLPRCGVAPLSAEGQSVPVGRALAVFYTSDCQELAAQGRLALTGAGLPSQPLELVPLAEDTYLLQAPQSVPAGDYQLEGAQLGGSALSVSEEERVVPPFFGTLSSSAAEPCPELLSFTLELDEAALALAPLARFDVSIDGGGEQLWVDYGALRVQTDEAGSRGVLELPRCGAQGCISPGTHQLRLRVRVAGQSREPGPLELDFEHCPAPRGDASSGESCTLGLPARANGRGWSISVLVAALGLGCCRRRARRG